MFINKKECLKAGLDIKKVASIARKLSKAGKEAAEIGLCIFGGSGTGTLRYDEANRKGNLIVGCIDGDYDGGDGAQYDWGDEYLRGE